MPEDYCELCDLPFSTCIHGNPPAPPPVSAPRASPVRRKPAATIPLSPRAQRAAAAAAPARPPSRVTAQAAFRAHIVAVLADAGGQLESESVMDRLAERMDGVLLDRDRQAAPTGEVRWQTAARKERKAMIDEGLVVAAQPGVWQLTDEGLGLA